MVGVRVVLLDCLSKVEVLQASTVYDELVQRAVRQVRGRLNVLEVLGEEQVALGVRLLGTLVRLLLFRFFAILGSSFLDDSFELLQLGLTFGFLIIARLCLCDVLRVLLDELGD